MSAFNGLTSAYLLDGTGGGRELQWDEVLRWQPAEGLLWIHWDYAHEATRAWLIDESQMDPVIITALLAEETRPRSQVHHDGLLVVLRGVNLNPGAEPDDMVAIRLWAEPQRIISTQRRKLNSVDDLCASIDNGDGPRSTGEFLNMLSELIIDRLAEVLENNEEVVDALEDAVLENAALNVRRPLADARRQLIGIRRYLSPQRDALVRLSNEKSNLFTNEHRLHARELGERMTRLLEDLDAARDRATVTHEELMSQVSYRMGQKMYFLSAVMVIFLPLTFVTGLLGTNVLGIPFAQHPWGFWIVCGFLGMLGLTSFLMLKRKKWL